MNRFDVGGRVVLITGGSRGLGRAMALAFAEAGARVAVASRKLHVCEDTVREIEARGSEGFAHACHVGHWDELAGLVDAVTARFGRIRRTLTTPAGPGTVLGSVCRTKWWVRLCTWPATRPATPVAR